MLMEIKLKTSTSFRALSATFNIVKKSLSLKCKSPTHTTLLNWLHKIGYYQLNKVKQKARDWIIILDESIQLGQDKVLVFFGIREKDLDFSRPLKFQDLVILKEKVRKNWNGETVQAEINSLRDELGDIKYAVGDYGGDLKKGLELENIPHIHDVTHKIALILEKIYKNNNEYSYITGKMSEIRIKDAQTEIAYIIPPKQRKKSRYQNIKIISDWCIKVIKALENNSLEDRLYEKLKWILPHKRFVEELSQLNKKICDIERILKYNGFSKVTREKCDHILGKLKSKPGIIFREKFNCYLDETESLLSNTKKILITSDIIESAFGKYKNYISSNPMAGITNLILSIAAFTSSLDEAEIKEALETTTINDINKWTLEYVGETLYQKRKKVLKCS